MEVEVIVVAHMVQDHIREVVLALDHVREAALALDHIREAAQAQDLILEVVLAQDHMVVGILVLVQDLIRLDSQARVADHLVALVQEPTHHLDQVRTIQVIQQVRIQEDTMEVDIMDMEATMVMASHVAKDAYGASSDVVSNAQRTTPCQAVSVTRLVQEEEYSGS